MCLRGVSVSSSRSRGSRPRPSHRPPHWRLHGAPAPTGSFPLGEPTARTVGGGGERVLGEAPRWQESSRHPHSLLCAPSGWKPPTPNGLGLGLAGESPPLGTSCGVGGNIGPKIGPSCPRPPSLPRISPREHFKTHASGRQDPELGQRKVTQKWSTLRAGRVGGTQCRGRDGLRGAGAGMLGARAGSTRRGRWG